MHATAIAHPNIALVKYWGKADLARNLPAVGSISITLDTLITTTTVSFDPELSGDQLILDGRPGTKGNLHRVEACLDLLRRRAGSSLSARVESRNSFPTGAGLASSASGFAALVVAADRALGTVLDRAALADLARRCSGSAARSLFGGFAEVRLDRESSTATTYQLRPPDAWPLEVVIAVTSAREKAVGSTAGMVHTEKTSPFYRSWVEGSETALKAARAAIAARDFENLALVSEHSCLAMHAVTMAALPGLVYWNGTTVECLHRVRALRAQGTAVFFTIDAGPQVKAVCLPGCSNQVATVLGEVAGVVEILRCGLGDGARVAEDPA